MPRAVIKNYFQIPPMDEVGLRRYVAKGPVAIGICGTDLDFMYYAGIRMLKEL